MYQLLSKGKIKFGKTTLLDQWRRYDLYEKEMGSVDAIYINTIL